MGGINQTSEPCRLWPIWGLLGKRTVPLQGDEVGRVPTALPSLHARPFLVPYWHYWMESVFNKPALFFPRGEEDDEFMPGDLKVLRLVWVHRGCPSVVDIINEIREKLAFLYFSGRVPNS